MAHTIEDKQKLLMRVRRIRGQVQAIEKSLLAEQDCFAVLQLIAACRGAIAGLMCEVIEGHIRFHVADPARRPNSAQAKAVRELIAVLQTYLK